MYHLLCTTKLLKFLLRLIMISLQEFIKISEFEWEIPQAYRSDMLAPIRVIASRRLLELALKDRSFEQAVNASTLPGLAGQVVVMPDVHQGYGFPIGGVAATLYPEGVISPGGIGYDINCGVRLLSSEICADAVKKYFADLANVINAYCPSGVGIKGQRELSYAELDAVCKTGSGWAQKNGFATEMDIRRTEEYGCIIGADPDKISTRAKKRGKSQLGSLGAGNHFIEVGFVEQIFDQSAAMVMGLGLGNITLMIHTGSRGLGHQVCTDYVQELQSAVHRYKIKLPDRELVCAPMDTIEGKSYLAAMRAAANFAFVNRQMLTHYIRQAFAHIFAGKVKNWHLYQVYDISHNIGKIESHEINGIKKTVCVHRKGATRAFGPESSEIPSEFRQTGQPVLVPGSMGTASWVLAGTSESMEKTFGSSCHGAGRVLSRSKAKHEFRGDILKEQLTKKGIEIRAGFLPGLAEEAPNAYKDVDLVVEAVCGAGITKKVARLKPLIVIKG